VDFWLRFRIVSIYIPLFVLWTFTLLDILRRTDLSRRTRARWALVVSLLPCLGTLAYLIVWPSGPTERPPARCADVTATGSGRAIDQRTQPASASRRQAFDRCSSRAS
jgi:hypothetical protein